MMVSCYDIIEVSKQDHMDHHGQSDYMALRANETEDIKNKTDVKKRY